MFENNFQANMIGVPPDLDVSKAPGVTRGGSVSYGGCGRATRGRVQCQICGWLGHLA